MDATYQSEIFNFLTKRDNFDSLVNLMGHYDKVREGILTRFWKSVEAHLKSRVEGSEWKVSLDPNIFLNYSKLQMYKPNWTYKSKPFVSVTWERLSALSYRGLLTYPVTTEIDVVSLKNAALEFMPDHYSSFAGQSWPWYLNSHLNFSDPKDLAEILPEKCDDVAKEWATELYELAITYEKQIDEIVSKVT